MKQGSAESQFYAVARQVILYLLLYMQYTGSIILIDLQAHTGSNSYNGCIREVKLPNITFHLC